MMRLILSLLVCVPLVAGPGQMVLLGVKTPVASGPQLIAHAAKAATGESTGATTDAVDTTGANLIVIHVSVYSGGNAPEISDSKTNTYTQEVANMGTVTNSYLFYYKGTNVGSGHTFTVAGTSTFASIFVQAWSGIAATPVDVESAASANATTIQPGSITPTQNNVVVISGFSQNQQTGNITYSVTDSFTISDSVQAVPATNLGGSMAYRVLTNGAATNPTWGTLSSADYLGVTQLAFKY